MKIINLYVYGPRAFGKRPGDAALQAVIAACAEERREALNEAANICLDVTKNEDHRGRCIGAECRKRIQNHRDAP